jgi:RNA polymerase sigma factor (sigma-70 family)
MIDDAELLRRYAADHSENDIGALVRRHVDLVYSSALRQVAGDHHRAQEVTQMVFIDLARKAAALARHPVLAAWLHRSSCLAAKSVRRSEGRRMKYERAAANEAFAAGAGDDAVAWEVVRPVLDEAINELNEGDRQAILLRFFSDRPFGDVGRQLGLTENAARMRVERALGKLRGILARRGIASSSAALAAALSGQAVAAAPAGVAAAAAGAATAFAGGAAGGWLSFMLTSKLPLTLTAAVLVGGAGIVTLQEQANRRAAIELSSLAGQESAVVALKVQNQRLAAEAQQDRSLQDDEASLRILRGQEKELRSKAAQLAPGKAIGGGLGRETDGTAVYNLGQLDRLPRPTKQIRPVFPAELRQVGASGQVLVDFIVGSDGKVYNAQPVNGSLTADTPEDFTVAGDGTATTGQSLKWLSRQGAAGEAALSADAQDGNSLAAVRVALESSAVQAVSQWTFQPGQLSGQSVNTHMQVPIVFAASAPPAQSAATWF